MSTVCQVCGDRGFVEALNYCSICRVSAQHRYCFKIIPKVLHREAFWVCDDCSSIEVKDENCVETEVVRFESQISPKKTHSNEKICTALEVKKSVPSNEIRMPPPNPQHNSDSPAEPILDPVWRGTEHIQNKNWRLHGLGAHSIEKIYTAPEDTKFVPSNENSMPPPNPQLNSEKRAEPMLDPVWRGTMHIQNRNWTLHGLGAYLSTQALQSKIRSVTSLFPNLLPLEILPRTAVWPKKFSGSTTVHGNDIALYFFPVKESDESAFDDLLDDMMLNDLAVKASFDCAELLIFTSLQLPVQHWRYKKKLYLWGLFRGRRSLTSQPNK